MKATVTIYGTKELYKALNRLPDEYKKDFLKMYPQAEYHEVKGVSHFFMMEIPYRTNQIIRDYLAEHYR